MSASLLLLLVSLAPAKKPAPQAAPVPFEEGAARLLGEALQQGDAYEELVYLSDRIGNRLAGSAALDKAVDWTAEVMAADGLVVTKEPVMVPTWIRGEEQLTALGPMKRDLPLLGLGNSIGTPEDGIEAEVVVVGSFDELQALPDEAVHGKIVVYDAPFTTYGETVGYRWGGASAASKRGAVAALVRSVGPSSLNTPHTGSMGYKDHVEPIPTAGITIEDATWMHRLTDRGQTVRLRLQMQAHFEDDRQSHNVLGEVRGTTHPDEVIVVGCHLDSWDVGQGAQDDGAGCVGAMEAVHLVSKLHPQRTVRAVMFTNEENGLRGGKAYAEAHADEKHIAAIESDTGSGQPYGFRVDLREASDETKDATVAKLQEHLSPLLAPIGAQQMEAAFGGSDISPLAKTGVPAFGVWHDTTEYFVIHHTEADTIDKVDPHLLNRSVAAMAVLTWMLSERPETVLP